MLGFDPIDYAGFRVHVAPETTKLERVRYPKRRHSRRWQKKFTKKYGWKTVPSTVPKDGVIMRMGSTLIMNIRTHAALRDAIPTHSEGL